MFKLKRAFRDFKRIKEISGVLFREGMGYYVHKMKLKHHLFLSSKERGKKLTKPSNLPEDLRRAMDELGPTFVKIGQFLSLRPDLIPENYCEEFSKLQDKVHEVPFKTVKKIIEEELKLKLDEVFGVFNEEPIASASIGQVYKAKLLNGDSVVVKVQRPKITPIIEADIDIFQKISKEFIGRKLDLTQKELRLLLDPVHFVKVTNCRGAVSPTEVSRMIESRWKKLDAARTRHMARVEKAELAKKKMLDDLRELAKL